MYKLELVLFCEVASFMPILHMNKSRLGVVKQLAQAHGAGCLMRELSLSATEPHGLGSVLSVSVILVLASFWMLRA